MPSVRLMIPRAERFPSVVKLQMEGVPYEERYAREKTCQYEPDYTGFTWWDENDVEHYEEDSASDECWSASCNKCGFTMIVGDEGWFNGWDDIKVWADEAGTEHHGILLEPIFKFCPNCGAKVVR